MTFEYLTTKDGLSDNRIQAFIRDHNNYIWIGTTENGLNKYDGYQVTVYEHDDNQSGSVSNNSIHCIFEDSKENLWIGTFDGLNLYHPEKDNFTIFRNIPNDTSSLSSNQISSIIEDKNGDIWIATEFEGLNKWVSGTNNFIRYRIPDSSSNQFNNRITDIMEDSNGNLWIVTLGRGIHCFVPETAHFIAFDDPSIDFGNYVKVLNIDNQNIIWIGSFGGGLYSFNPITGEFVHFETKESNKSPNSNMVRTIIQEDDNHLLIGTDQGGINRYNKNNQTFEYILSSENQENGLNNNGIVTLYKDWEGILWIGTSRGGVNYHNPKKSKFKRYSYNPTNPKSLSHNVVGCFFEDHEGLIWIGTDGGGVNIFDPGIETFVKKFKHDPLDPYSLSGNVIRCIAEDKDHEVWISTWDAGLNRYDRKTGRFYHYFPKPENPLAITGKTIWHMKVDNNNELWLGGYDTGVEVFNKNKGVVKRFNTDIDNHRTLFSNNICLIYEDEPQNIWICTNYGLYLYNRKTDSIRVYNNFPDNNIRAFCKDKEDNLWAGSLNGMYSFKQDGTIIKTYNKTDGLPHNTIHAIVEDNNGNLWISTKNGLSKFNPKTSEFRNYDETDGLPSNNLFEQSFLKTQGGEIYVGGYNGFISFQPDSLKDNDYIPQVYITDFKMFNKPVSFSASGKVLTKHISETDEITLSWKQSVFSFGFTAINYTSPEKNQYAYIMEGFEENWNYIGNRREATYTNLDPGDYLFRVKASNNDGVWNEEGTSVRITILPPFWKTNYAYAAYVLIGLGLILLSWRIVQERERLKHNIELEKQKAARAHELDLMKIKFFTNISHEFRTPLSLILSPVEKLIKQAKDKSSRQHLKLIFRNAKRLLMLINQLLDYRKMEAGQLKLNPVYEDIITFSKEISFSFSDISENKNIKFSFHSNVDKMLVYFDKDKLEKILLNLLSNAFKFTTEKGSIDLAINVNANHYEAANLVDVEFILKDTGIGIPANKQEKIFTRFFQNELPDNIINQGSGIGLSITHEFVKLHGGTISVESEVNKGTCFTVHLPLKKLEKTEINFMQVEQQLTLPDYIDESDKNAIEIRANKIPMLLLVEDNEDFRFYLRDNLKQNYRLIEAANGKEAWNMVLSHIPDLIISDLMMPEMDGFELCSLVKKDKRTCHIPVILLTAKASSDNKIEGLEIGADDYVAKPFYIEILESRIKNLIHQREMLREVFREHIVVKPTDISITSLDEKFLQKAFELVEENITNSEFSVKEFSKGIGMSRAYLYQKLVAITGKSPLEFVRTIRLKRAAQLLKESQLSVSEIAYEVGFNNPKLFTKHFKSEFNETPSQFIKNTV